LSLRDNILCGIDAELKESQRAERFGSKLVGVNCHTGAATAFSIEHLRNAAKLATHEPWNYVDFRAAHQGRNLHNLKEKQR
jgi:hypothetical protein